MDGGGLRIKAAAGIEKRDVVGAYGYAAALAVRPARPFW